MFAPAIGKCQIAGIQEQIARQWYYLSGFAIDYSSIRWRTISAFLALFMTISAIIDSRPKSCKVDLAGVLLKW
jgi:hypothetical protein